ncbi:MAG: hypothetical protein FWF76_05140 [Oscillospiraceae bacterium]|nr:hypothetical protein [Oscillospiraceae bacterium]
MKKIVSILIGVVMMMSLAIVISANDISDKPEFPETSYADIGDVVEILRDLVGLENNATVVSHDFNNNNILDIGDALFGLRGLVGLGEQQIVGYFDFCDSDNRWQAYQGIGLNKLRLIYGENSGFGQFVQNIQESNLIFDWGVGVRGDFLFSDIDYVQTIISFEDEQNIPGNSFSVFVFETNADMTRAAAMLSECGWGAGWSYEFDDVYVFFEVDAPRVNWFKGDSILILKGGRNSLFLEFLNKHYGEPFIASYSEGYLSGWRPDFEW